MDEPTPAPTAEEPAGPHGPHHDHLAHRLRERAHRAFWAVPRGPHAVLLVICMVLGFALVTQVRSQRQDPIDSLSEQDLVVLLDELTTQERGLRTRRTDLQDRLSALQNAASQQEARDEAAQNARVQAEINAGTVAVHGPGVVMRISDPAGALTTAQFVMTLGELRNAGAEAIELNGNRLSTRSSFTSADGRISVDGAAIDPPYEWKVIGSSQTISTALEIQAGSASQMRAKGAVVSIDPVDDVVIDSLAVPLSPQYASFG